MTLDHEKRDQLQRLARAIDYHIVALSVIPVTDENAEARAMHERLLSEAALDMKGLLT